MTQDMEFIKYHDFGPVKSCELGWSPAGRPLMTVHCFILGSILIDTGLSHMQAYVLNLVKQYRISQVLLTHHHEDHSGNAAAIAQAFGIPVLGHPETVRKMRGPRKMLPYQHLMWGRAMPLEMREVPAIVDTGKHRLTPIHTPGHSRDHTVYLAPELGILFSGDLYLSDRIKYFRSDEQIGDQIRSLKHILSHDFEILLCNHRPQLTRGRIHLARKLQYLEDFKGNVAGLAEKGMTASAIMQKLRLQEQHLVKWICFGNVSMKQMVRSVISDHRQTSSSR